MLKNLNIIIKISHKDLSSPSRSQRLCSVHFTVLGSRPQGRMALSAHGEGMPQVRSLKLRSVYEEESRSTLHSHNLLAATKWSVVLECAERSCSETPGPQHRTNGTGITSSQRRLPWIVLVGCLSCLTIWGGLFPVALHKTCLYSLSRTILLQLK